MKEYSAGSRLELEISDAGPGVDVPLWLLQKDDSRFLYISLFLSLTVHIILFVVMAATRIFHPFAGASQEFDLVWFSPAAVTTPTESSTPKPSVAKQENISKAQSSPATEAKSPPVAQVKAETHLPPSAETPPPTTINPPQTPPVSAQIQTSKEVPFEEPAEMVLSRFSGKVVEVVDKKADIPAFTVISSVKMKSEAARTVVQNVRETGKETRKPQEATRKTKPAKVTMVASLPKEGATAKREEAVSVTSAPSSQSKTHQDIVQEKPIQGIKSSSSAEAAPKQISTYPAVNRSINSFAAALQEISSTGSKLAAKEQASAKQANSAASTEKTSGLHTSTEALPPTRPATVEKPAEPEVKKAAQLPPPPQILLQPSVTGDLKLVITGDVDIKVEAFFKPFPKNRRGKAFTRWEAEKRRIVLPKMVRTKENVHEAVLETTEEGVYSIVVRPNNGKQGAAELVLKIRESRPGAKTKNLGSRKIDGTFEVAKVLMPEGILWTDDSYFTGDMEDADSITKFHTGTGLMWREYK